MVQPPPLGTADDEERKTRQGAVVWAKVTGFPWWPAYIAEASVVQKSKRKRDTDYWCVGGLVNGGVGRVG